MVFDAVGMSQSNRLSMASFRACMENDGKSANPSLQLSRPSIKPWLAQMERFPTLKETVSGLINEAMARAKNNQRVAALMLGITPQALNQRLKRGT